MKSTLEILRGARQYLADPKHWHKGSYFPGEVGGICDGAQAIVRGKETPCCVLGACYAAAVPGEDTWLYPAISEVEALVTSPLAACIPEEFRAKYDGAWVPSYNDDPETTHQDVLNLLDCAIAKQEIAS